MKLSFQAALMLVQPGRRSETFQRNIPAVAIATRARDNRPNRKLRNKTRSSGFKMQGFATPMNGGAAIRLCHSKASQGSTRHIIRWLCSLLSSTGASLCYARPLETSALTTMISSVGQSHPIFWRQQHATTKSRDVG